MDYSQTRVAYTSVGGSGNVNGSSQRSSRPKTRTRLHDFRPIPLRLPFLLSFVTLSAAYIVLIELLLHYAKGIPASSNENVSEQRLFRRQSSGLSTSTVYVTSTAAPVAVTVTATVTGYEYTTLYPSTYTGTGPSTVMISSSALSSKTSTPSIRSTSSSLSTGTKTLSIITSGQTSYYVTTSTAVVSLPGMTLTVSFKTLQTVLVFDRPTSSQPMASSTSRPVSGLSASQALSLVSSTSTQSPSIFASPSILVASTAVLPPSQALHVTSTSIVQSPSSTGPRTYSLTTIVSSSVLNFMSPSTTYYPPPPSSSLPASLGLSFSLSRTSSTLEETYTTSTAMVTQIADSSMTSSIISSPALQKSSLALSSFTAPIVTGFFRVSSSTLQYMTGANALDSHSSGLSVTRTPTSTSAVPSESALVVALPTSTTRTPANIGDSTRTVSSSTIYSATTKQSSLSTGSSATTSQNATSTSSLTSEPTFVLATTERQVQGTFNMGYYVSALYIPALLAIIIKTLWEIVFASTRLMQPFERMATPKGVSGRYSVFAQYLSSSLSLDVIRALGHGNPIPLLAELSYILVQIGTPIAAIAMTVKPRARCDVGPNRVPCDPVWVIDVPLLRVIEAILGVCLLCVLVILFMRARHRSGVDSDPSSLGSIAHVTNEENLLASMQACAIDDEPVLFEQLLRKQHFRLTEYSDKAGHLRYGIISARGPTEILSKLNQMQAYPGYHTVAGPGLPTFESPTLMSAARSPIISPAREAILLDFLGLLAPVALLTIIVSFWLDGNLDDAWNRFFLTPSIWPKLLLVGLATASSILVTNVERIVRITEPFRRLNANSRPERTAPPATTLLISRSGTAYSTIIQCMTLLLRYEHRGGRMGFQFLVALTVVISDLNIVAVAGIAWTEATTQLSFQLSMIISMALTGFVILVWLIIIFWWRRHRAVQVLRASNGAGNVAGTMRYLTCGSKEIAGEVARMYEEWYNLGSRSRYAGQWRHYQAVFGQHVCDDQKVRWCISLQKMAPEVDEVQDFGERDSRPQYH